MVCPSGVIASYLHASSAPGLGKMGALVALADRKGALDAESASQAKVCSLSCLFNPYGMRDSPGSWSFCASATGSPATETSVCRSMILAGLHQRPLNPDYNLQELGGSIAMHIVATRPLSLDKKSVPPEALEGQLDHSPEVSPRSHLRWNLYGAVVAHCHACQITSKEADSACMACCSGKEAAHGAGREVGQASQHY